MRRLLLILSLLLVPNSITAQDTYQIEKPFQARSLAGVVVDNNGSKIPGVLVEWLGSDRKSVQDKKVTDTEGAFVFSERGKKKYLLRLTKDGWSPMYVTVIVDKKAKANLELTMNIAR